jgi:hypothetical protein
MFPLVDPITSTMAEEAVEQDPANNELKLITVPSLVASPSNQAIAHNGKVRNNI